MQTGVWKIAGAESEPLSAPSYNSELIGRCLRDGEREEAIWARFFEAARVEPLQIEYEQLCDSFSASIGCVLEFIGAGRGLSASIAAPRTVRQGDEVSDQWCARFRAERSQPAATAAIS